MELELAGLQPCKAAADIIGSEVAVQTLRGELVGAQTETHNVGTDEWQSGKRLAVLSSLHPLMPKKAMMPR